MAFSVNTNESALLALQTLNVTSASLQTVQSKINTGLKVATSKDNAAVFAIAQNMRAQVSGLNAVQTSIDRAISTTDVALAAGQAVSDLLIEMKEKAVSAADAGLDTSSRTSLNEDFIQLRDQIDSIVDNASFNGINAVGGPSPKNIVAITSQNGTSSFTVAAQDLSLGGGIVAVTATTTISANATTAAAAVTAIETSIDQVNTTLGRLGAGAKRLELQKAFTSKLSDAIEVGIGNLVDADMAKASAELQSLQVKQQLGLQALGIANQAPGAITQLFQ